MTPSAVARTRATLTGDTLEQLVKRARHSVCVALTDTGDFSEAVLALLATIPARAVVRVLCTAEAVEPVVALSELPDRRVEVRV
ncbi:MAG: DNA-binding response regulator, partial [Actinomycetes bacterium]